MWRLRGAGRAPLRLHGGAPSGPLRLGRAAVCTHDLGRAHYSPHGLASRCVLSCRYALWHPARQRINGTSQGRTSGLCASGQSRVSLGGLLYRREASRPTGRRAAGRRSTGREQFSRQGAGDQQAVVTSGDVTFTMCFFSISFRLSENELKRIRGCGLLNPDSCTLH